MVGLDTDVQTLDGALSSSMREGDGLALWELAEKFAESMKALRALVSEKIGLYDSRTKRYYDMQEPLAPEIEYKNGDLVLLRSRRAGGLKLPAQGPYRFKHYRGRGKLTADIEDPLSGKVVTATVAHLLPY